MRYIILIIITLILSLFILFYNPYLGIYKNQVTIEYDFDDKDYVWNYNMKCDSLKIDEVNNNKWILSIVKNGDCYISFEYKNINNNSRKYFIEYNFKIKGNNIYWTDGQGTGLFNYPNPY